MPAYFGPGGNSKSFYDMGYKSTVDAPRFVRDFGLDAYEYEAGNGISASDDTFRKIGEKAKEYNIKTSIHAPYYISMSSVEEDKRLNSINYILQSARAVKAMGGNRIIVHTGSCGKISREEALSLALDTMKKSLDALDSEGLSDIHICPETMGKVNQLGTLDEVMALCSIDERLIPCIDFGHLNARDQGILKAYEDFENIFKTIKNKLGEDRLRSFHSHFSKIEYSKGGEVRHLTFTDEVYGPNFEPVMELCHKYSASPTFICESAGTQAEDAKAMKDYYWGLFK